MFVEESGFYSNVIIGQIRDLGNAAFFSLIRCFQWHLDRIASLILQENILNNEINFKFPLCTHEVQTLRIFHPRIFLFKLLHILG